MVFILGADDEAYKHFVRAPKSRSPISSALMHYQRGALASTDKQFDGRRARYLALFACYTTAIVLIIDPSHR
jgi:hypothetical protein